jgi:alpha-tubulin suppressor-like RCC1 family protein
MKFKTIRWPVVISLTGALVVGFLFQNCAHNVAPSLQSEELAHDAAESVVEYTEGQGPVVAAGNSHTCATNKKGEVFCWGKNRFGLSGGSQPADVLAPSRIDGLNNIVQLAAGNDTNCALTRGGEVFCWGSNGNWGLGVQGVLSGPAPVKALEGAKFIDGDYQHFCAVTNEGTVKCWGTSGAIASIANTPTPIAVSGLVDVEKVNVGLNQSCAVLKGGRVKCWGAGNAKIIEGAAGLENVVSVDAGLMHACALKTDGSVMCWGGNNFGQSGNKVVQLASAPTIVPLTVPAQKITVGANTSCALLTDGSTRCWGNNVLGQFGMASTAPPFSQEPMAAQDIKEAFDISMGADHACVILKTRRVRCWGVNAQGQLGNGSLALGFSAAPIEVAGLRL